MQPTDERWLPITGYEGRYEVSDQGRVRSLDHMKNGGGGRSYLLPGRVLSLFTGDHYTKVRLKRDGQGRTCNIHALVARAFLGAVPDGMEVCHNNGQRHDNRVSNLRYDTHSENQLDQARHGVNPLVNRTHCNHGHLWSENTVVYSERRRCRECQRAKSRRDAQTRTAQRRARKELENA